MTQNQYFTSTFKTHFTPLGIPQKHFIKKLYMPLLEAFYGAIDENSPTVLIVEIILETFKMIRKMRDILKTSTIGVDE